MIIALCAFPVWISSAPAQTVPTQNLKLWLKADAGVTMNGTKVSKWVDQSGSATNATQTNASLQPTVQSNAVNGKPVLQFNGSNQTLGFTLPVNGLTGLTMVMVANNLIDTDGSKYGTENVPLFWGEAGNWGCLYLGSFSRVVRFRYGTGAANNMPSYTRPAAIGTKYSISIAVKNAAAETLYVNGAQVLGLSGKLTTLKNIASKGNLGRGYSSHFKGGIAEVLVYTRALSDAERRQVEQYLTEKYLTATPAPGTNKAPAASAGAAQTIMLPAAAALNGTASDDNLPSGVLTTTWSKVSGPGTVSFANAAARATTATFSAAGTYQLRLTASDGALQTTSDVAITVNNAPVVNNPPAVSAGAAQTITLPTTAALSGTVSDDNLPNGVLTTTWSKVSGPGTTNFANGSACHTTAAFSAAGTYLLRLTASDGAMQATSDVTVAVNEPVQPDTGADVVFPPNSGVYNVKDYGARGDGSTDDTAAIKAAMKTALGRDGRTRTLYFPAGTYIVSDTLLWAEDGTTPAQVTANIDASRGCITSFNVINGGHGYRSTWTGGPGVYLTGGGGSGANLSSTLSGDALGRINVPNSCTGRGYSSAPTVRVVNWRGWFRFQGQNQAKTVIKLRDYAPGFSNANCSVSISEGQPRENCRAVVYTSSQNEGNAYGSGESAYETDIWDMSIDTGKGNPGAIALDWVGSNRAAVRNVTLRSGDGAGRCGLNLTRSWMGSGGGPGYIKNLTVEGFDYGVRNGDMTEIGYTMEHVTVKNQRIYGVMNQNVSLWIRGLKSTNSVPAVLNVNTGSMVLLDATLDGGSSANSAILNQGSSRVGQLYARNITTSGYQSAVRQGIGSGNTAGSVVAGTSLAEYTSAGVKKLQSTGTTSLKLPIKDTPPEYVDNDFSHWAIVTNYGAYPNDNGDDTAGIQAALNAGKAIVFMPAGQYKISSTLRIPSGVRKVFGVRAGFANWSGSKAYYPVFSCESKSGGAVELRNIGIDKYTLGYPAIRHACSVPFIITDLFDAEGYFNVAGEGTGDVYMENVAIAGTVSQHGGNLWARQLDVETGNLHLENDGATMWVLGYKTEGKNISFWGRNGGRTEILGAFNSLHGTTEGPGYKVENSAFAIASLATYSAYSIVIQETRNGVTKNYGNDGSWTSGTGFPLFIAY